jgi:hypothetical protein
MQDAGKRRGGTGSGVGNGGLNRYLHWLTTNVMQLDHGRWRQLAGKSTFASIGE